MDRRADIPDQATDKSLSAIDDALRTLVRVLARQAARKATVAGPTDAPDAAAAGPDSDINELARRS